MRVLVTGGTGYLGKEVVDKLAKKHEVVVLTRKDYHKNYEVSRGNICNFADVRAAVRGCEAIIHLAVESNHSKPWNEHFRTTVLGTRNILRASLGEVDRVVHMSSMATDAKARTNYVNAKAEAEEVVKEYWDDITVPVLKPSSIYDAARIKMASRTSRLPVPRVDTQFRPIYRTVLHECIEAAMENGKSQVYRVGDSKVIKLTDFIKAASYPRGVIFVPGFLSKLSHVSARARFFFEDKIFSHDMKELGVKPVHTLKTIFQIKFGDEWKEKWREV